MNLLTINNMTKVYGDKIIFDNVDFSVNDGEKIGIIGINGTGKSTLLKIIAGIEKADTGDVIKGNKVYITYLPQNPEFENGTTIYDYVIKANSTEENKWQIEGEAKNILNKLGFDNYDIVIDYLSGGQKKRVALAAALLSKSEIIVLDEPTNHIDNDMACFLEDYLKKYKGSFVMVTHDRYFLDRVVNKIVEIDKGKLYSYNENYGGFVKMKAEREDMEAASERKRVNILRNELEWIRRGARARSTKQKARIERYETLRDKKAVKQDETVEISLISSRLGKKTIELNNITKSYDGNTLIDDFTHIFLKGEAVGFIGRNGCGKSTLLKIINGLVKPEQGNVEIGDTIKIGYFSQENEYMDDKLRVIDYIREGAEFIQTVDGQLSASAMLERFLFDSSLQYSYISKLSGGEKRRLYLLRVLMESPNVLILDEPTNDLDISTMTVLEDYLDGFDGIIITVSHDRYFIDRVVDRLFVFKDGGKIEEQIIFDGDELFSDIIAKADVNESNKNTDSNKNIVKQDKKSWKSNAEKKLKMTYQEQKDFETIENDIMNLEEKLESLELEMEKFSTDFIKLNELVNDKEKTENLLEEKMDRWMYLEDLNKKIEEQKSC